MRPGWGGGPEDWVSGNNEYIYLAVGRMQRAGAMGSDISL